MTRSSQAPDPEGPFLPLMPDWITQRRDNGLDKMAFLSGAALAHLHLAQQSSWVPAPLWRSRLALDASVACLRLAGRPKGAPDLRDALHFLRPGDHPGPAGEVFRQWSRGVERPLSTDTLRRALPHLKADWLAHDPPDARQDPVARAAGVVARVLTDTPRATGEALLLGDATLARVLGWRYLVPVLALGVERTDLRKQGDALHQACHRAVVVSARHSLQMAEDLARRATRLEAVVPRLRAKAAGKVVELMLSQDAVAPAALASLMSDRAARRLCDRLLSLGVLRELTGRESFRLYGV